MAIPSGYTKIEAYKLYENVEYYIDTSGFPDYSISSNITQNYPYLTHYMEGGVDPLDYIAVQVDANTVVDLFDSYSGWDTSKFTDGIVTGYPTLNINLTTSPDWLYVKAAPDYSKVKTIEVTAEDGTELSFAINTLQESKDVTITANGTTAVTADEGYDGIKTVNITTTVEGSGECSSTADTAEEMTAFYNDVSRGNVIQYVGETTTEYENGRCYLAIRAITFTIDGTSYAAEYGMTWKEWVDTDYNTGGWYVSGDTLAYRYGSYLYSISDITLNDAIIANNAYTVDETYVGGGGAD